MLNTPHLRPWKEETTEWAKHRLAREAAQAALALAEIRRPCRRCGVSKPLAGFPANSQKRHGKDTLCLDCKRENSRGWREAKAGGRPLNPHGTHLNPRFTPGQIRQIRASGLNHTQEAKRWDTSKQMISRIRARVYYAHISDEETPHGDLHLVPPTHPERPHPSPLRQDPACLRPRPPAPKPKTLRQRPDAPRVG